MSSLEIVNAARAMLANEPRIGVHSHKIKISVEPDGVLVLEGEVPSIAAKKLALLAVGRIPEITGIADRLRVEPSRRMTDAQIRDHLRDALLEEPAFDRCAIRVWEKNEWQTMRESVPGSNNWIGVSVGEGVVTLDGQVDSLSHQRLAGALAWWVPGSRDVINGLELWPQEQDSDDEITEAVKLVLEKDPLVNGDQVGVHARDGVVTLEGVAANEAEEEMIETDAWCVVGVERVINRLQRAARG